MSSKLSQQVVMFWSPEVAAKAAEVTGKLKTTRSALVRQLIEYFLSLPQEEQVSLLVTDHRQT